ncbi:MAG TPA: hypothetical protein VFN57_05215 [Thermomicrobiaceae bacterium]|nr:hypothetical protein [Thermomicrobiaceae bacterium]
MFGNKQPTQQKVDETLQMMEEVPLRFYWGAAIVSLSLSGLLYLAGKRTAAIFVGQWPPTLILLSLFYRLLRPSQENPQASMQRTMKRVKAMTQS